MVKALTPEGVRSLVLQIALSKNPNFLRHLNRLSAVTDLKLPVDVFQVSFDGSIRNKQFFSNLIVPLFQFFIVPGI